MLCHITSMLCVIFSIVGLVAASPLGLSHPAHLDRRSSSLVEEIDIDARDNVDVDHIDINEAHKELMARGHAILERGGFFHAKRQTTNGTDGNEDLAREICGEAGSQRGAASYRNQATWRLRNLDDWLDAKIRPMVVCEWHWLCSDLKSDDPNTMPKHWQDWLWSTGGPEGAGWCTTVGANCEKDLSFELCQKTPESHFHIWATMNYANFLNSIFVTTGAVRDWVDGMTADFVKWFFTEREPPTKKIKPLAIAAGVFSAITALAPIPASKHFGWFAGGAIAGGAMSITQGILTQDELNRPNPLDVWSDIQPTATKIWESIVTNAEKMYKHTLLEKLPTEYGGFVGNKQHMQELLRDGKFAEDAPLAVFDKVVKGAIGAGPVNALWIFDGAFFVRITSSVMNGEAVCEGDGTSCSEKYHPEVCYCMDGAAYYFIKWVKKDNSFDTNPYPIDTDRWFVRGAYTAGPKNADGEANKNYLKEELDIDLDVVIKSSKRNQDAAGGEPLADDGGVKVAQDWLKDPKKVSYSDLVQFSLPVVDVEVILKANGYTHWSGYSDSAESMWQVTLPCTARAWSKWPGNEDGYSSDGNAAGRPASSQRKCGGWREKCENENQAGFFDKDCKRD